MALPTSAELVATIAPAQFNAGLVRGVKFTLTNTNTGAVVEFEEPVGNDREVRVELTLTDLGGLIGPWGLSALAVGQNGEEGPSLNSSPASFTLQDPTPAILQSLSIF